MEEEQKGEERAEYGKFLLKELSEKLTNEFGKGFSERNLRNFRQFYLTFSIRHAVRTESQDTQISVYKPQLRQELSWTHYRLLIKVENPKAREWYMNEAVDCGWSSRALQRQINSLYVDNFVGRCWSSFRP